MASTSGAAGGWNAYRRGSASSQGSAFVSASRRPSYQHEPLTGAEPVDFHPERPASATSRRPSVEHSLPSAYSSSALSHSRNGSGMTEMLVEGPARVKRMGSRDLGYRVGTPDGWERELILGEEARGSPARRRSEDAAAFPPTTARKGSTTSLRREAGEAGLPSTPSRRAGTVDEREEDEELTPRGAAGAGQPTVPRSRQASLGSQASTSKPLHTPPTMFPSGIRQNSLDYSPSRSSSQARLDAPTSSSSTAPTSAVDGHPSRASSPSSSYSHSSVSSDPPDDWATSHLPSGSSPPRSPLLADLVSAPTFRQPSLAQAAAGLRESRPISEFDFAAAYAHSDGSLPPSPAIPAGFTPIREAKEDAPESPPLPPLPPKDAKAESPLPTTPVELPVKDSPPTVSKEAPQPAGVPRPVLALQTPLPASPSVTAASASPTSAVSTVGPLPPAVATTSHLSPTSTTSELPPTSLTAPPGPSDRPSSRSSTRSYGPSPQRPPRRQPSNLSLMSQKSGVSATSAAGEGEKDKASSPAEDSAPAPASTAPPPSSTSASDPLPPSTATTSTDPPLTDTPSSSSISALSEPRTRPRGLSSVQTGSISRRDRGPPPDIPEKSRRRTSTLMSPSSSGKRLSSYGALGGAGIVGGGFSELSKTGSKDEAGSMQTSSSAASFAEPRASLSLTDGGYLRDSFYDTYAQSAASSYPASLASLASPPKPSSHFREASSANHSPVASPVILPPSEEPSRDPTPLPDVDPSLLSTTKANHVRSVSDVSVGSTAGTGAEITTTTDDFHSAHPTHSSHPPPPRSASALSSVSSAVPAAVDDSNAGQNATPAPVVSSAALQASLGNPSAMDRFPPRSSSAVDLARAASPLSEGGNRPRSNTPSGRGDAKARAAAFIADLKKAKAEAAAKSASTSAQSSPAVEQRPTVKTEGHDEDDTLIISSQQQALPMSPTVVISPSLNEAISAASSPMLPSIPHSPEAPDSPIPPLRYHRSGSTFTTTTARATSSPPLPPFPPHQPTKRPSQSSILTTSSISKPFPRDASFSPPTRSNTLSSLPPLPPSSPASTPLLRRRPLPMAIQVVGELKRARTPRERSKIYAEKINDLARERSRLEEWIGSVRDVGSAVGRTSVPSSPAKLRAARQESSTATFAPRPGETYRAREIPSSSFGPKDLVPSAPYPGVLGMAASKYASNGGGSHSHGSSGGGGGGSKSFFSGLGVGRGSLGRRASKRDHHTPHHHASSSSGLASHSSSTLGTIRTSTISGPIALNSAPSTLSSTSGLRSIGGPRMPNPTPPSAHRASFDSRVSSPSGSPVLDRYQGPASANPARASFSYGTSPVPSSLRGGLFPPREESLGAGGAGPQEVEEEKVDRLADILPQAERKDLVAALVKAGGDDVLAISVYLSDEASKR